MKKIALVLCAAVTAVCMLAGCSAGKAGNAVSKTEDTTVDVVCTVFAPYDWMRELTSGAQNVRVTLLAADGTDLHNYQPTVSDVLTLSSCDVLVYVGGESDGWVKDVLADGKAEDVTAVSLMDYLHDRVKTEAYTEGMQVHGETEQAENDEHVWLSLDNARACLAPLADALCLVDPAQEDVYRSNQERYGNELTSLRETYTDTLGGRTVNTVIVADRFPFRYLFDEYGIDYDAAFPGCSAETGASFDTVLTLAGKIDALALDALAVTESADGALAQSVAENAHRGDVAVVTLHSLQSVNRKEIEDGISYLAVMRDNLDSLCVLLQVAGTPR